MQTAKSMKDANLEVDAVDDVVLVGGSTRIPKVGNLCLGSKLHISGFERPKITNWIVCWFVQYSLLER